MWDCDLIISDSATECKMVDIRGVSEGEPSRISGYF
jgi:hypothetical protein